MNIEAKTIDNILYLTLHGKLGAFFGLKDFQDAIRGHFSDDICYIIMDTSDVDYISSSGIRVLIETHKRLKQRNGVLALVGLQPYCNEVLNMVGLANEFSIFTSVEQADKFCQENMAAKRVK